MVHITIAQDGTVTGDKGKIIAYTDSCGKPQYSETIQIVHPSFTGCEYYLEYRYRQTLFSNKLDAYGNVVISIIDNGNIPCQLVAKDVLTGFIMFKSNPWHFIVKPGINVEPSHYPCPPFEIQHRGYYDYNHCRHHNHMPPPPPFSCGPNDKIYEALYKMNEKLENEEEIRYAEIQDLIQQLYDLKEKLNLTDPTPSSLDANQLVSKGSYLADETSINFPKIGFKYKCEVSLYDNIIMQIAYELADIYDASNVWYRIGRNNGIRIEDIDWDEWAPFITRVMEG